jgi:hypothetical protein
MRSRILGFAALLCVGIIAHAAEASVVYVTYTGAVIRGTDPGIIFGQGANLNDLSYEVLYVFDTGSYQDSQPTENFVFGGAAFGTPSPLVGSAILTIGSVSIEIRGDSVGEIQGIDNGPGAFSEQLHRAYDTNLSAVENSIFNYAGELPATIMTPFVYDVTSSDGGNSDFSAFGASGNLSVTRLVVSLDPPTSAVPEPSTGAMMILGFAGIGFMAARRAFCKGQVDGVGSVGVVAVGSRRNCHSPQH